tara:strand:+ start:2971 stop:4452 length:1482 start_codon:yes stop_codon:yes gene_type:complete
LEPEINAIIQSRLKKLEILNEKGIDPYPTDFKPSHSTIDCLQLLEEIEKKQLEKSDEILSAGRITALRKMGKAIFIDILDEQGKIQLLARDNTIDDNTKELLDLLDIGDWIGVCGPVFRTRRNEPTIQVNSIKLLSKSIKPLPEKWHGLKNVETRYRQRYLDLIANRDVLQIVKQRDEIVFELRNFMKEQGFVEVDTPILVPIPAGGMAHPFKTYHNALDRELYLRIATELYLKRMIVGGIEKVYEIGRLFRNEGIDSNHNPEFTTMESYEAYADYNDVMEMVENLFAQIVFNVKGSYEIPYGENKLNFKPPWKRVNLRKSLIEKSGIDYEECIELNVLKEKMSNIGIDVRNQLSWAGLMDKLISEKLEPDLIQPTFLIDYPLEMSPLAKRSKDNPNIVERFEGFIAGMEVCNAFTELNDPVDQRSRFENQEKMREQFPEEERDRLDEDFLVALEHGMPPTGGVGIGIDRMVMLILNQPSIREVISFPQLRSL